MQNSIMNLITKTSLAFILASAILTFGFNSAISAEANIKNSEITWTGYKVVGSDHTGSISLKSSNLIFDGKVLTGGEFVIDMTSITNTDVEDLGYRKKLVGHLNSDDFFGVAKYATSTLKIKSAKQIGNSDSYTIKADLTIKSITLPITFKAKIKYKANNAIINAVIKIDRTKHGIKYGSNSFFDNLADKAIDNIFKLDIKLSTKIK